MLKNSIWLETMRISKFFAIYISSFIIIQNEVVEKVFLQLTISTVTCICEFGHNQ